MDLESKADRKDDLQKQVIATAQWLALDKA